MSNGGLATEWVAFMTRHKELERAALFRASAAELREIAPTTSDAPSATQLLKMALTYDRLAIKLEGPSNDDVHDTERVSPDAPAGGRLGCLVVSNLNTAPSGGYF